MLGYYRSGNIIYAMASNYYHDPIVKYYNPGYN